MNISTSLKKVTHALLFGLSFSASTAFAQLNVAPTGNNTGNCQPGPCLTITYALSQAPSGASINIAAGTYNEALRVTQSVTLNGAAAATTIIAPTLANQLPAPAPINAGSVIIDINGAGINVVVRNLTVRFPSNNYPALAPIRGIWVTGDANARIENNIITEIHDANFTGFQTGDCVRAGDPTRGGAGTYEVINNQISRCQKTGITANQPSTNATIRGNTVFDGGVGERNGQPPRLPGDSQLATNGIQVAFGARAIVDGNAIRNMQCNLASPACGPSIDIDSANSAAILVVGQGAGTVISNNTISNSDDAIAIGPNLFVTGAPTPVLVTGNILTNNRYRGFLVQSGTTTLRSNSVTGGQIGLLAVNFGESVPATAFLNDPSPTTAGGNSFLGASINGIWLRSLAPRPGVDFGAFSPSFDAPLQRAELGPLGVRPLVQGSLNQIVGNAITGADNDPNEGTANLTCNWWGSALGPGTAGANPVTANVLSAPWAINNTNFNCPAVPSIGLGISKLGPASVQVGQNISYTIAITNTGPADGAGSIFTDNVPTTITNVAWTCAASAGAICPNGSGIGNVISQTIATLPVGGQLTYVVTGTVTAASAAISNTATITPLAGLGQAASATATTAVALALVTAVNATSWWSILVLLTLVLLGGVVALRFR
jgi:uncharacterized repeat protein (TIGR01451 family)